MDNYKPTELNLAALGALMGYSQDWRGPLTALLRSNEPIDETVRMLLLWAIQGNHPSGLVMELTGHGDQARRIADLEARRRWLKLGREVAMFVAKEGGVTAGILSAEEALGKDESECRKRYYYAKHCGDWIAEARATSRYYGAMSDSELEDIWHLASIDQKNNNPKPLSGTVYDIVEDARRAHILNEYGDDESGRLRAEIISVMSRLCPPDKP
jgi:hypothetical protein